MFAALIQSPPETVEVREEAPGTYCTFVPIAYCRQSERAVAVKCELAFTTTNGNSPVNGQFHEFSFSIVVVRPYEEEDPFETQDRNIARRYLPDECIPLVMPVVLRSLDALVARVKPKIVYRVTKMRNPSPKALKKHEIVTNYLLELGYVLLQESVDGHNRRFWQLGRAH